MKWITCVLLALVCALGALAQPDPNNPPPPPDVQPNQEQAQNGANALRVMSGMFEALQPRSVVTDAGLFELQRGMLVKYDPVTLKVVGQVDLIGTAVQWPADNKFPTPDDHLLATIVVAQRMMPGILVADGTDIVAVFGPHFYRIDGATLQIKVNMRIANSDPVLGLLCTVATGGNVELVSTIIKNLVTQPPVTHNGVLYLIMNGQNIAVNMADGTVQASAPEAPAFLGHVLPPQADPNAPVQPQPDPLPAGGYVVLTGVVARHDVDNAPVWTLKDDRGVEVTLWGDPAMKMTAGDDALGARVLVCGTYDPQMPPPEVPNFGGGNVEVSAYLVLEHAKG